MKSRGQFNFVWIFALLVGAAILFFAIYGAMKAGDTARLESDSSAAKSLNSIFDPLQAGFTTGKFSKISFREETRIYNDCSDIGFGKNEISVASLDNKGDWGLPGFAKSIQNKYVFSPGMVSGKNYQVFSKPFSFPYKVADLIFLIPDNYCFVEAPDEIVDDIGSMGNRENIILDGEPDEVCGDGDVRVCFGSRGDDCDIVVHGACRIGCDYGYGDYDIGTVSVLEDREEMEYFGPLMYGAIFSEKDVYDCNVKRLLYRAGKIAEGFSEKADLMNARGCGTNLKRDMVTWSGILDGADSDELGRLQGMADDYELANKRELCGLW